MEMEGNVVNDAAYKKDRVLCLEKGGGLGWLKEAGKVFHHIMTLATFEIKSIFKFLLLFKKHKSLKLFIYHLLSIIPV